MKTGTLPQAGVLGRESCTQAAARAPRNPGQETAISVQFVPGLWFFVFDCEVEVLKTTGSVRG
eukprot:1859031-Rhodomonas_salina.3